MNIKKLKIIGIIIAFLLTFPLHFLYDKLPCFLTSIIAPVNESIWEHMKILFGAILISGIIEKIIVKTKKLNINNVFISNFLSALISIPIFLIMFMPVYNIIISNYNSKNNVLCNYEKEEFKFTENYNNICNSYIYNIWFINLFSTKKQSIFRSN